MLDMLRKRQENEEGFTLIELMVVVLIIAILLAIAIPTFLGARDRANDRAAQSSLRNGLTAAKTLFTDNQDYTTATSASLQVIEPSISFVATGVASTDFKMVSVDPVSATSWVASAKSKSGTCFTIRDNTISGATGGTMYASDAATCDGTNGAAATFSSKW